MHAVLHCYFYLLYINAQRVDIHRNNSRIGDWIFMKFDVLEFCKLRHNHPPVYWVRERIFFGGKPARA